MQPADDRRAIHQVGRRRIVIENMQSAVAGSRFSVRRAEGESVVQEARVPDLLSGTSYTWCCGHNFVQLDPALAPAHRFDVYHEPGP